MDPWRPNGHHDYEIGAGADAGTGYVSDKRTVCFVFGCCKKWCHVSYYKLWRHLPDQYSIFKDVGGWQPCMYPLENLNSYIDKRILVSSTFLRSQKSLKLTFKVTPGPMDFLCFFTSKLVSRCWSSTFLTRKGAKRRRTSHQMVNRLSHGVEVQYKRWNRCKVQVLNKHVFQAPSWLNLGPSSHSLEGFKSYITWTTCSTVH